MSENAKVRLTAVGGDRQYHYANFILEYERTTARISVEVEGRAPRGRHAIDAYRKLLHHIGVVAQKAASSDELSMSMGLSEESSGSGSAVA
jgi:hypothetical protein